MKFGRPPIKITMKEASKMKNGIKRKFGFSLALILSFCLIVLGFPFKTFAADGQTKQTMTFEAFLEAVENGNGTFDGQGVTIEWKPVSGCEYNIYHNGCLFNSQDEWVKATTQTPQRVDQLPNAQYQLFKNLADIHIRNVNFKFIPADFILCKNSNWKGTCKAETTKNAEFQFLNTGNVTLENCTFDQVIASPYGGSQKNDATRCFTVTNCTFKNVYNAYALKDILPATATITGNTFVNCSGAIYFEGSAVKRTILIQNNKFDTIDTNAAVGKEYTRGIVQFSGACQFSDSSKITLSGNTITGNLVYNGSNQGQLPVIRQLSNLGGIRINGWTPGEPFSIKVDAPSLSLPDMSSNNAYSFKGWVSANAYKGPLTSTAAYKAGDVVGSGMYYAVWEAQGNTVTVVDSYANAGLTGAGIYNPGETVTINAGEREGYVFAGWTINVGNIRLLDDSEPITTFTMPSQSVVVTANWCLVDEGGQPDYRLIVRKIWEDDDEEVRPDSVTVRIYRENEYVDTVKVYEKYNWRTSYPIEARYVNDSWWVEEVDVPDHYNSSVEEIRKNVFYITNTFDGLNLES